MRSNSCELRRRGGPFFKICDHLSLSKPFMLYVEGGASSLNLMCKLPSAGRCNADIRSRGMESIIMDSLYFSCKLNLSVKSFRPSQKSAVSSDLNRLLSNVTPDNASLYSAYYKAQVYQRRGLWAMETLALDGSTSAHWRQLIALERI